MDYRKIEDFYEKLCKEIDNQTGKDLSAGTLDTMHKLSATIHYLDEIMKDDEEDYSERGRSYRGRSYEGRSYEDGRSMRRGQRRDSMGRYSRNYSREYSRGGDFEEELRELMEDAPDERTREAMRSVLANMK